MVVLALAIGAPVADAAPKTKRVNVAKSGAEANDVSNVPSLSWNGRFVAFSSYASTLIKKDQNGVQDVFVRDRKKGKTRRVTVTSGGAQVLGESFRPDLSRNGKWVAFESDETTLVPGDGNGSSDIFRRGPLR